MGQGRPSYRPSGQNKARAMAKQPASASQSVMP